MANIPTSNNPAVSTGASATTSAPDLAADANALMDEAKSAASKVADEARDQVATLAETAKAEVGHATEKAKSMLADQKGLLVEQVGGIAEAMKSAAGELEQNNGSSAQYVRMIADNADKLTSTIRDNDVDQLLHMAQDFGRRQPAVFMGAAALLGFAASRFVMASAARRETNSSVSDTYGSGTTANDYRASYSENSSDSTYQSPMANGRTTGGV